MNSAARPLVRPDRTDPDGFSRRVAEAYNAVAATTNRPGKVLAAEAGVPVTTVHRWIREARQRGHLSPYAGMIRCPHCRGTGQIRGNRA